MAASKGIALFANIFYVTTHLRKPTAATADLEKGQTPSEKRRLRIGSIDTSASSNSQSSSANPAIEPTAKLTAGNTAEPAAESSLGRGTNLQKGEAPSDIAIPSHESSDNLESSNSESSAIEPVAGLILGTAASPVGETTVEATTEPATAPAAPSIEIPFGLGHNPDLKMSYEQRLHQFGLERTSSSNPPSFIHCQSLEGANLLFLEQQLTQYQHTLSSMQMLGAGVDMYQLGACLHRYCRSLAHYLLPT